MSGMKFRLQCSGCSATFFAPDRKSRHCPKCVKKGASKKSIDGTKLESTGAPVGGFSARLIRASTKEPAAKNTKPRGEPKPTQPKAAELTPELREQIARIYQEQFAGSGEPTNETFARISDNAGLQRKHVPYAVNRLITPAVPITPEVKERIIETYKGYVERSERPAGGRRRAISVAEGIPFHQVKGIIYGWSQSQYAQSPTPELSREQLFEIEKAYWDEMVRRRYHYSELAARIAERLGYVTAYQVSRWLDMLHDDQSRFDNIADAPPEAERRIIDV